MTLVTGATGHGKRAVIGLSRAKRRESLWLPTGHGRVAPISRDDVAAAVAAVAAKPNKSRIIYMITGHRALGFGEIAASYGETIVTK